MPGRAAASLSSSDWAGGSGSSAHADRAARRATRRMALITASSPAASGCALPDSGALVAFADPGALVP
jgi:hypothetical protein